MDTLQIKDGDFVVGPGGFGLVSGQDKVRQDLNVLIREPFGIDRFHPKWGTVLTNYIGQPVGAELQMLIRSEISRLVQNYAKVQQGLLASDAAQGKKSRFGPGEIIQNIAKIDIVNRYDEFHCRVHIDTRDGSKLALTVKVTP